MSLEIRNVKQNQRSKDKSENSSRNMNCQSKFQNLTENKSEVPDLSGILDFIEDLAF